MPRPRWQEGSVSRAKRKKGDVWVGRWRKYLDGRDKPLEQMTTIGKVSEMSKTDARLKLRDIIAAGGVIEQEAQPAAPVIPTVKTICDAYLALNKPKWRSRHLRDIENLFKDNFKGPLAASPITDVTRVDLQVWLNSYEGKSIPFVHKLRTYAKAIFDYAIDARLTDRNPAAKLDMPKMSESSDRFLTEEECRILLAGTQGRDHLIVRILLTCALRPAELFALKANDVETGRLRVDEALDEENNLKCTKTEESNGYVALPGILELEIRSYIAAHRLEGAQLLFASRRSQPFGETPTSPSNYLRYKLQPIAEKLGIFDLTHQALRRTTATHLTQRSSPKDAQKHLRHRDSAVTMKYYIKSIPESVTKAALDWDLALREKPKMEKPVVERQM